MFPNGHSRSAAVLPIVFWILAISYLAMMHLGQYPLHYLHKATPLIILLLLTIKTVSLNHLLLVTAILFSMFGDVLLALQIKNNFTLGLSAFLIAQCCYGLYFQRWREWRKRKWPLVAILIAYTIIFAIIVIPASGSHYLPVSVYLLTILFMAGSAILARTDNYYVLCGALFFVMSDSLIAINKFVLPLSFEGYLIMSTYYIAQYLIVTGCLKRIGNA